MNVEELSELIRKHKPLSTRYYDQKSYKLGMNAGIFQQVNKPDPDNRIPVPFIRRALKLIKGYFAKVGNISYHSDGSTWFADNLQQIYNNNNEQIETGVLFEDAITYGSSFELHWYEDDFEFCQLPVDQCIPIYSNSIKPKLMGFIWHRKVNGVEIATYYDDKEYQQYVKTQDDWKLDEENSGLHLYGRVPVLEANVDRDKRNLFDHCLPIIDMYDKIISEVGNEHEKFANSILLLRDYIDAVNKDEDGLTAVDKINRWRILDKLGDNVSSAAAYLERNVNDTFIKNTLELFERLIYEMLCVPNPNDDTFAAASGIAQAYKLLGLELMIADVESYFSMSLQERIKIISGHALFKGGNDEADNVTITFRRNLPFDIEKFGQLAVMLTGGKQVLSRESILKMFPAQIVPSVEDELARLDLETPKMVDPFGGAE